MLKEKSLHLLVLNKLEKYMLQPSPSCSNYSDQKSLCLDRYIVDFWCEEID